MIGRYESDVEKTVVFPVDRVAADLTLTFLGREAQTARFPGRIFRERGNGRLWKSLQAQRQLPVRGCQRESPEGASAVVIHFT